MACVFAGKEIMNQNELFSVASCSCMQLISQEGNPHVFRTCDLDKPVWEQGAHVVSFPSGKEIKFTDGRIVHAKNSVMGITYNRSDTWLLDGINDKGLMGALLYLREGTGTEPLSTTDSCMGMEVVSKLLFSCNNTDDVMKAAKKMCITNVVMGEKQSVAPTMHYFFTDENGNSIVMEAADADNPGCCKVYGPEENIGILTNSPPYPMQLENLQWFLGNSKELSFGVDGTPIESLNFEHVVLPARKDGMHFTQGNFLPGGYSAYDRFVRLALFKALNHNGMDVSDEKMFSYGNNIMNSVWEPSSRGFFHYTYFDEKEGPIGRANSHTHYLAAYDIKKKELKVRPYDTVCWTKIRLEDCHKKAIQNHPLKK